MARTKLIRPGRKLDAYHDGKTSPSRLRVVEVLDHIKIEDLGPHYVKMWRKAIIDDFNEALIRRGVCYCTGPQRFWDWNCDSFIFAKFIGDNETDKDPIMFAKRGWGGWYGVNYNYMLDVSGKVRKEGIEQWRECAKERGLVMKRNRNTRLYEYFDATGKRVE